MLWRAISAILSVARRAFCTRFTGVFRACAFTKPVACVVFCVAQFVVALCVFGNVFRHAGTAVLAKAFNTLGGLVTFKRGAFTCPLTIANVVLSGVV